MILTRLIESQPGFIFTTKKENVLFRRSKQEFFVLKGINGGVRAKIMTGVSMGDH